MIAAQVPSIFHPASGDAASIATLTRGMLAAAIPIFLFVAGVMMVAIVRKRRHPASDGDPVPAVGERQWIVTGGLIMPVLVLAGVFVATLVSLGHATRKRTPAVEITVTGRRWWWETQYGADSVDVPNELHIPVGAPVLLHLQSADVIHSFWVPQLNGKTDLIPGQQNSMILEADSAGTYRGSCAEFCGTQHAKMAIVVVAQSPADYASWLAHQRDSAGAPADSLAAAGAQAFAGHACSYCHAIRGTAALGRTGPDLTHIGSRLTLASGSLPNTDENLGRWITGSQDIKPGSTMPQMTLDSATLRAIVHYLRQLH